MSTSSPTLRRRSISALVNLILKARSMTTIKADVGEAVPFLDVAGGCLSRHLKIVKIKRIGHDLSDIL